jgi:hypothetical protein
MTTFLAILFSDVHGKACGRAGDPRGIQAGRQYGGGGIYVVEYSHWSKNHRLYRVNGKVRPREMGKKLLSERLL